MRRLRATIGRLLASLVLAWPMGALADDLVVATASNFLAPMNVLVLQFASTSGHAVSVSSGSTAKLYTQIVHGAPFDIFLSADQMHVQKLVTEQLADASSRFTYSRGRLVLWAGGTSLTGTPDTVLADPRWARIAIANPSVAPYGAAALEVVAAFGLSQQVQPRLVYGESIAQAHAMVATGAAPLGILSRSQVLDAGAGTWIAIDPKLHSAILQDAVILNRAAQNKAAHAFMAFLRSAEGQATIESFGYAIDG